MRITLSDAIKYNHILGKTLSMPYRIEDLPLIDPQYVLKKRELREAKANEKVAAMAESKQTNKEDSRKLRTESGAKYPNIRELRELCVRYGVKWNRANDGKRHMTKPQMIAALEAENVFFE